jgi:DNA (cytosine-5)-methyltransferase 1
VRDIAAPLNTITANGISAGIVTSHLLVNTTRHSGAGTDTPLPTITTGGHLAEVRAFLIKYYSEGGQDQTLADPMHTVPTKDRIGLVTVVGEEYVIADIGLRMLAPRELFKAQGFPADYIIGDNPAQGLKLTKTAQVRMCGNSVCPPLAEALVRANLADMAVRRHAA